MTRTRQTGRTGYDTNADTQSLTQFQSLHEFTQAAMDANGVSQESDRQTDHDKVAQRAFELYEQSGCRPGRCDQNWAQAEIDLRKQMKGGV